MELNKTQRYLDEHSTEHEISGGDPYEVLSYYDAKTATKLAVYEYIQTLMDRNPTYIADVWASVVRDKNEIESKYKKVIEKWM